MKLATLKNETRDGELVVVSRDLSRAVSAKGIAPTLQSALDHWLECEPKLKALFVDLESGRSSGHYAVDSKILSRLHSPLPRAYAWMDGSAYINHVVLVRKARGAEPPATLKTDPLMYQGGSDAFLAPTDPILMADEAWGIDFESEVCVVVDDVPMGVTPEQAFKYIRLLMICNDVSLRNLIPAELEKGFGFFQSKPSSSFAPFAVTPDELGEHWKGGRVHLPLVTWLNGQKFGDPEAGPEMYFDFGQLIAHACKTRALCAGAIIGSGTVSNADRSRGSSCLAEKRMIEKIDTGSVKTSFMKFGDRVEIEMFDRNGKSIFGRINQTVLKG